MAIRVFLQNFVVTMLLFCGFALFSFLIHVIIINGFEKAIFGFMTILVFLNLLGIVYEVKKVF